MLQNSGNILFISDRQAETARFRRMFVDYYNIFTAHSIREGYQLLQEYDIHVVLIRQQMTEMTGLQFCESIGHEFPNLLQIILIDSADTRSLERAVQQDLIFRYVEMPFRQTDLKMTIDGALKLSIARQENQKLQSELAHYRAEQENILQLFKRYVPAEVVQDAIDTGEPQIIQPGESRIVSVLFSDIRGFSRITSLFQPEQVVSFLNDYWETVSKCINKNKGSVNKYIGDGMLAVFGAPISYINNHENAVKAALDMVNSLDKLNEKYAAQIGTEIKIGVGVNSGEVIVGNVGTNDFMEYTVIGETVNIASRLEAVSKEKPNSIIISQKTGELVHHSFELSALKKAVVNGKNYALNFYEVLGPKSNNVIEFKSGSNLG